jgi:hypothetical protein
VNIALVRSILAAAVLPVLAAAAERPRVFITESQTVHLSGDAAAGDASGSLSFSGGSSSQNTEAIRVFTKRCPDVVVTSNPDKADYVVRLDHEGLNPGTPFVHGNKVAIFDAHEDLIHSDATRLLRNAVKNACQAINSHVRTHSAARDSAASGTSDLARGR